MARPDKVAAVEEIERSFSASAATLLTDYRGLSVGELAELRAELRKANASYKVVKNTLTRRAADAAGIEGLVDFLVGPTALVFCEDDPVGPAKALKAFMKDHPELLVKAGYLDGEVLDEQATIKLADLESREELLARFAGLLYGALANFARLLNAPLEHQARLIQALIDDGGTGVEEPAPVDEPTADAADDAPAATAADAPEATAADAPEATAEDAAVDEPEAATEEADAGDDRSAVADAAAEAVEGAATVAAAAVEQAADVVADTVEKVTETVAEAAADEDDDEAEDEAAAADEDDD